MAVYHWLKGLVGLWASWVAFTFLGTFVGYIQGINSLLINTTTTAGIAFPSDIQNSLNTIYGWFNSIWNFVSLAVFTGFIIYIIINSARRDVENEEFYTS